MAKKKDDNKKEELELQLTEAQQLFCRLYVLGTMSNKECYLTAFKNSSPKSAEANSSRLLKNEKIIKYINTLLDEMADNCEISDKEILRELKRLAFGSKNDNARIKALQLLGQITGLFGDNKGKVTNNVIQISVEDKQQKKLEDNGNGRIIGSNFNIVVDDDNGME